MDVILEQITERNYEQRYSKESAKDFLESQGLQLSDFNQLPVSATYVLLCDYRGREDLEIEMEAAKRSGLIHLVRDAKAKGCNLLARCDIAGSASYDSENEECLISVSCSATGLAYKHHQQGDKR